MTTKRISAAAAATLLATSFGATIALAQGNPAPSPQQAQPHQGMMMDRGGMMDMTQMNRMMENCNRMMESMQQSPAGPKGAKPNNG